MGTNRKIVKYYPAVTYRENFLGSQGKGWECALAEGQGAGAIRTLEKQDKNEKVLERGMNFQN